jgi:phosphoglycolate phosphatase
MLHALRARHHWLAIATGKSRRGLSEALEAAALGPMFDATRTAEETASKPNPLMLMELMRTFGVEPERTLMIGDTSHDLLLAANAGVTSVGVSYGAHDAASLAALNPRYLASHVAELHQWLLEHA